MSSLIALAERCERAAGWDFALDREIWHLLLATDEQRATIEIGREAHGEGEAEFRTSRMMDGASYTASIDDALALVPDGWAWMTGCDVDEPFFATLAPTDESGIDAEDIHLSAATPALALCAAALRAVDASAIEARRAATVKQGAVGDESAVPKGDAQP